jgi:hypothetical protein
VHDSFFTARGYLPVPASPVLHFLNTNTVTTRLGITAEEIMHWTVLPCGGCDYDNFLLNCMLQCSIKKLSPRQSGLTCKTCSHYLTDHTLLVVLRVTFCDTVSCKLTNMSVQRVSWLSMEYAALCLRRRELLTKTTSHNLKSYVCWLHKWPDISVHYAVTDNKASSMDSRTVFPCHSESLPLHTSSCSNVA